MNAQPLVSIIIPIFNRAALITETLDSIQRQTYKTWECIVVDDGSTDTTEQVMQKFVQNDNRFQFYKRPETLLNGGNSCRNYGFTKANGDCIQWFDSDDLLVEKTIEERVEALKNNDDAVLSGFNMFEEFPNNVKGSYNCNEVENVFEDYLLGNLVLNLQSIMFKKEVVQNLKFSETLTRAQDLDFVYRCLSQNNIKITHIPKAQSLIRLHSETITAQFSKLRKEDLTSEILVREAIFFDAMRLEKQYRLYPAQRYFNALKNAVKAKEYQLFTKHLLKNSKLDMVFKIKLLSVILGYRVSKRGLSKYNELVNEYFQ